MRENDCQVSEISPHETNFLVFHYIPSCDLNIYMRISLLLRYRSDTIELWTHVAFLLFYTPWFQKRTVSLHDNEQINKSTLYFLDDWLLEREKQIFQDLTVSSMNREVSTPALTESSLWEVNELYVWPAHSKPLPITFPSEERDFWVSQWECVERNLWWGEEYKREVRSE